MGKKLMKTTEELTEIAKGIHNNTIFCDLHIAENELGSELGFIFLPIMFGAKPPFEVGMVYSYRGVKTEMPRAVNGYPCFSSVYFLNVKEADLVKEKLKQIEDKLKKV